MTHKNKITPANHVLYGSVSVPGIINRSVLRLTAHVTVSDVSQYLVMSSLVRVVRCGN